MSLTKNEQYIIHCKESCGLCVTLCLPNNHTFIGVQCTIMPFEFTGTEYDKDNRPITAGTFYIGGTIISGTKTTYHDNTKNVKYVCNISERNNTCEFDEFDVDGFHVGTGKCTKYGYPLIQKSNDAPHDGTTHNEPEKQIINNTQITEIETRYFNKMKEVEHNMTQITERSEDSSENQYNREMEIYRNLDRNRSEINHGCKLQLEKLAKIYWRHQKYEQKINMDLA